MEENTTHGRRAALAAQYATEYSYMAMAPVGDPRPDSLRDDKTFNNEFVVIPFGGVGESGWAAWFFDSSALRDAFVRRHKSARPLRSVSTVARRPSLD